MGPNQYPDSLSDPERFRTVVDEYHSAMMGLTREVLKVLALTLGLEEDWFEEFAAGQEPMAVLRLLHYPAQEPTSEGALEKGKSYLWKHETSVVKRIHIISC